LMLLIDGDIIAYRAGFSVKDGDFDDVIEKVDELTELILNANLFFNDKNDYQIYLTGKGNFRYDIAKDYKANRKTSAKPEYLTETMGYLIEEYGASVSDGQEADDDIATRACSLDYNCTIASIDKDFLQIPCDHYNFYHYKHIKVSPLEAHRNFYMQLLTGDVADNIKGVKGLGPVKARKIIGTLTAEKDMYRACLKEYKGNNDLLVATARLLWLRRKEGELWEPPA
jgi:5'-3' exonuclease